MSQNLFMSSPPQYVYDNYKAIRDSDLLLKKTVNHNNIVKFEEQLNLAQPKTEDDQKNRSLIQYLYRKNPTNFCRFLVRSRLSHLILWTEAKCIVRYFGLRGVVYVKWDDNEYKCNLHKNINSNLDDSTNENGDIVYKSNTYDTFNERDIERLHREDIYDGRSGHRPDREPRSDRDFGNRRNTVYKNNFRDSESSFKSPGYRNTQDYRSRDNRSRNYHKEANTVTTFESTNIYDKIRIENTEDNFPTLCDSTKTSDDKSLGSTN
jgi:hypothetical protein